MNDPFYMKYRRETVRLQHWNYANQALYFVTICTKNRENYFGEIVLESTSEMKDTTPKARLQPTEIGAFTMAEWFKCIEMRPDMNLTLGEFVVMPNHIHGIIGIGVNEYNSSPLSSSPSGDAMHRVATGGIRGEGEIYKNQFAPQSKNLASIIRGYKSAVTTYARKNKIEFEWQSRYHEHIIRSVRGYNRISQYIINNPQKWLDEKIHGYPAHSASANNAKLANQCPPS